MPYINWPRPQETGAWSNVLMSPKNIKCNGNEAKLSECQVTDYSNSPDEKIFCRLGSPVPGNEGREMACAQCSGMFHTGVCRILATQTALTSIYGS